MTVVFLALSYWTEKSLVTVRSDNYADKIHAAGIMEEALEVLKNYRLPGSEFLENKGIKDPLAYTILGEKDSPITTDEGRIEDKVTVLNPNFAAVMVDMLIQLNLKKGDTIAVSFTGSMPGANIATLAAVKALGLHPIIITSVGSSWWGANSPDFTWLDMETVLYENMVFDYRSTAASAGGSDDNGGLRLSDIGKTMIADAINRNNLTYIKQGSLSENIEGRCTVYKRVTALQNYAAIVNIGGGIATLGHRANGTLIPNGTNQRLPARNYPNLGVVHYFAQAGVPVVHVYDVQALAVKYGLPTAQLPVPKTGVGKVFEHKRYNLMNAWISLVLMFIILVFVKVHDYRRYKWREEKVDQEINP